jgi:hypothetical protein
VGLNKILPGALQILDVALCAAVEGAPSSTPPPAPQVGRCYLVGAAPSGAWIDQAHALAAFTHGGWRFIAPPEGMTALVLDSGATAVFRQGGWVIGVVRGSSVQIDGEQVVGPRLPAIPAPSGGTTIDTQARTALAAILSSMRQHGLIGV